MKIVSEYSEILGLDTEKYYDMYLAAENKAGICDLFAYNSFDSIAELKKVFNEITVINQINIQQSHGGKKTVIAQCAELLPQSVTGLSDSKMTSLALKLMSLTKSQRVSKVTVAAAETAAAAAEAAAAEAAANTSARSR